MSEFKITDREILFIYLADGERSHLTLPEELRNKICAVRHVRGDVKKKLVEKVDWAVRIYDMIVVDPTNPNLPHLKEDVVESKAELKKYEDEGKLIIPWLQKEDPHLYEAAQKYVKEHRVMCGCETHSKSIDVHKQHDNWVESLKGFSTADSVAHSMTTRKRTRKNEN